MNLTAKETSFLLAMGQMRVAGGEPEINLGRAAELVAEASAANADLVLLPEALDLGWGHPCADSHAQPIPGGHSFQILSDCARGNEVWICAGLIERDGEHVYNSAVLIDRDGRLVLKHRKINELDFARGIYRTGEVATVVDTELARIGVMICADAFIEGHTVSRALGEQGADVILSPCAWAVPADHDNAKNPYGQLWIDSYQPVAKEFSLWVAGVSNVGTIDAGAWAGRKCIGCSLLVDPAGRIAARGAYGEGAEELALVTIDKP